MGRYYKGDIEGKFWFGVQSSADADFFGVKGYQPEHFFYNFEKDDLENVKKGIEDCEKELGEYKIKLDKFFKNKDYFNRMELKDFLKVDENKVRDLLKWNARLHLGLEIKSCIEKKGQCHFEAEL